MRKILSPILIMLSMLSALSVMTSYVHAQDNWNILAVDTNTHSINLTNEIIDASGATSLKVPYPINTNDAVRLDYILSAFATRTNLYNVTGSVVVSNSLTFTIPLLYSPVNLADCRFYLSTTNGAPISRRAKISIMQNNSGRCTDLIYLYTNQLYYSTTTTVAGVVDAYTNVVGDASGFIINDMYVKPQANPVTWQTVSNYSSTVVYWNCSNMVSIAVGGLISHVNRFQIPWYIDKNGGTNLNVNIQWTSGYTNTIGYSIDYYRK